MMIYVINTRTENTVRKGESTVYQPFDNIEGKQMLIFSHNAFLSKTEILILSSIACSCFNFGLVYCFAVWYSNTLTLVTGNHYEKE